MNIDDVTHRWQLAAESDEIRRVAIHPAGRDPAEYEATGKFHARQVFDLAPPWDYPTIGEFGCGDGRILRWLPRRVHTAPDVPLVTNLAEYDVVWAVDAAPAMLDALPDTPDDSPIHHRLSNGVDGSLPIVNAWYSSAVFIHQSYADGAAILAALAEATTRGGRILVDVPVYDVARERQTWTDVTVWDREQFAAAARAAGLTVTAEAFDGGVFSYQQPGPNHAAFSVLDVP